MRILAILIVLCSQLACASSGTNHTQFESAPVAKLPLSVGGSSYGNASYDVALISTAEKKIVNTLFELIKSYVDIEDDLQYINVQHEAAPGNITMSKLPCLVGVECYLVGVGQHVWLITWKDKLVNVMLVNSTHYEWDDKGAWIKKFGVDATFGDGVVWQTLPVTKLDETGIFCRTQTNYEANQAVSYKVRIKQDGSIESKEVEVWSACKSPW